MHRLIICVLVLVAACGDVAGSPLPELTARCGAVELPVTDTPVLPDEPLDDAARAALDQAKEVVGGELELFDFYDWFIAERSDDRLVLFGSESAGGTGVDFPYADMVLVNDGDGWKPEGWGQCHIQVGVEGYGNARWVLDAEPSPDSAELSVLINERNCANGRPPEGRDIVPVVVADIDRIIVTVVVEPIRGDATCPSNPWHPVTIDLGEPIGDRLLLDGSTIPPRVQEWPPPPDLLDL